MKYYQKLIFKFCAISTLFFLPFSAFAGSVGTITFAPVDPSAIPTLSSTMLIVLSVLLMMVAFRVSKQKSSKKFLIALFGASVLIASTGGVKLVSDLQAGGATITMPEGQTFTLFSGFANRFDNSTNVPQRVISISGLPSPNCPNFPDTLNRVNIGPDCSVGLILQPSSANVCKIDCQDLAVSKPAE